MKTFILLASVLMWTRLSCAGTSIPFTADRWHIGTSAMSPGKPDALFSSHEGFPGGVLFLKAGQATLRDFSFRSGTIEFDLKSLAEDLPGIQFRMKGKEGAEDGEEFYIRTSIDCRASNDCIQYAPVIHGFLLWNSYPQYQKQAFVLDGWNHIRLVVSEHRLNVFINNLPQPALQVGRLEGESGEGAIELRGPAIFANFTVSPGTTDGLEDQAAQDPSAQERGLVRRWELAPLTDSHFGRDPRYDEMPSDPASWRSVGAERFGLVNLNRQFSYQKQPAQLAWLKTTVTSDRDTMQSVSLGWVGHAWIFVNGALVTQGKNYYYPESERRNPDGRVSLENGSFDIPLKKGRNEIVVAMHGSIRDQAAPSIFYGWGLVMRFNDTRGLLF